MFESLQERLGSILNGLTGRGALSEADVSAALREVRRALLEADVALEVVRSFTDKVREKAVGAAVLKSIKPGQMVVKIVHDKLVVHQLDDHLPRLDRLDQGDADGLLLHVVDKRAHHVERDVRLEQRAAHLAQRGIDVGLRERAAPG